MKKKKDIEEIEAESQKKPSRLRKWAVRLVLFLLLFVIFTISGAFVALQFKSVRTVILDFAEDEINKSLNAKVNVEDFTLTSLKSADLFGVSLVLNEKDTIAFIPEANAIVNLEAIINGKIFIPDLTLHSPRINMLRNSDGVWNVSQIPKVNNDTTAPPDTKILFSNLKLMDADFKMYDPYAKNLDAKGFNTSNLHLKNLNFTGSLYVRPTKKQLKANLDNFSFYETVMKRRLTPTHLEFAIDSNFVSITNLDYKSNETSLNLDAKITGIDIFGGINDGDFEKAEIMLDAKAVSLNIPELMSILDVPVDFRGTHDMTLKANGTMNNINIQDFKLKLDNSNVKIKGNLKNVTNPDKIYFDLTANNSHLAYNDVIRFLNIKNNKIPDFIFANFNLMHMTGTPRNLLFGLDVNSGVGNINGDLVVQNNNQLDVKYDGLVRTLNANKLYPNTLETNINGELHTELLDITGKNPFIKLRFDGGNNSIDKYNMTRLKINMESENFNLVRLDTLYAEFGSSTMVGQLEKSYIQGNGQFDISDKDNALYNLDVDFNAINLKQMLENEKMPTYLSGSSKLRGKGIELRDIVGEFDTDVRDIVFEDRAFFPFGFSLKVDKFENEDRLVDFNSDFGSIVIQGNYNFENTLSSLQNQGYSLYNFIANEVNKLIPSDQELVNKLELMEVEKIGSFDPIDANLKINVSDFSFLSAFMDSTNLRMNTELNFHIFAKDNESSLYINSLNIENLYYNSGGQTVTSRGLTAEGGLYMKIEDSSAVFSDFKLLAKANEKISINENTLNFPSVNLEYDGKEFNFTGQTDFNNQIDIAFDGNTTIIPGGIHLGFSKLDLSYQNEYNLSLSEPIDAKFVDGGFTINSMELTNPNTKERINLGGEYNADDNRFNNFTLTLNNLDLQAIKSFVPRQNRKAFEQLSGRVDSLNVVLNGDVENPKMKFYANSNDLSVNEQMVGDIDAELEYANKQITGNLVINHYSDDSNMPDLVKGEINSLPIDLSLTEVENRFSTTKSADMEFVIDSLPLSIISPFVPSISYLKGIGKGKLLVGGYFPDDLNFNGIVRFDNTSFLVDATNVGYRAKGGLILKDNKVFLEDVKLYNLPDDLRGGVADVSGNITLDEMNISGLDLGFKTNRFLVMHDETQKAKSDLFGRLIISTEKDSLRFYGSFEKPNLDGYVAIESADLKMPDEEEVQLVRSKFIYKRTGNIITATYGRDDSVKVKKTKKAQEVTESLFDLLNMDLDVEFRGRTLIDMQINQFLSTSVIVGTPINLRNIRYVKNRNSKEAKLYGRIILKEGSKLSFFKTFDIEGDINFPTGNISNPTLDLIARYEGTTTDYKKYKVEIFVTGTKENPDLRFEYEVGGETGMGDREKKLSDIISLLLTGRANDQTATNGGSQEINLQSTIASDIITRQIAQELGKLGLSAQIDFDENFEDARVKIGGDIVGGARWSFGGNVNDISGSRLEIEIPLDDFLKLSEEDWLNILLNFTYVNSPETVKTDENQIHWEGKLKFGGSW